MLNDLAEKMNDWYNEQGTVMRFLANLAFMSIFVTILVGACGLYGVMFGYTLHLAATVTPWFLFLLIGEISIPIGIWFAADMYKDEKRHGR